MSLLSGTQMRKIRLIAVAATMVAIGFGVWAAAPTNARVPSTGQGIEPMQLMMNAKGLAIAEAYDHGFVLFRLHVTSPEDGNARAFGRLEPFPRCEQAHHAGLPQSATLDGEQRTLRLPGIPASRLRGRSVPFGRRDVEQRRKRIN
jgi:hypothetical protein